MFDRPRNGTVNRSLPYFPTNSRTGSQSSSSVTDSSTDSRSDWLCCTHSSWNASASWKSMPESGPSGPASSPQSAAAISSVSTTPVRAVRKSWSKLLTRRPSGGLFHSICRASLVSWNVSRSSPSRGRRVSRSSRTCSAVCARSTSRGLPPSEGGQYSSGSCGRG
jgi:hypothetical protein